MSDSSQAAALQYVSLGERAVAEPVGLPADTPVRSLDTAAVIGAGTMGVGIAMCFADAGIPVVVLDADPAALEKGLAAIRRSYESAVARQRIARADMDARLACIQPTLSYDDLRTVDIVVEAVFEDIAVKREVFARLDGVARPGAILATNTSYLDVSTIASFTHRPADVVGLHFFSPANVMRLLEIVRTPLTSPDVLMTAMALARRLRKVGVIVGGSDGFVGNRMLAQRTRETWFLLEEGALPRQVDRVRGRRPCRPGYRLAKQEGAGPPASSRSARQHAARQTVRGRPIWSEIGCGMVSL
jgi:3-hydroxyacyl-CoA dehydrogenase